MKDSRDSINSGFLSLLLKIGILCMKLKNPCVFFGVNVILKTVQIKKPYSFDAVRVFSFY